MPRNLLTASTRLFQNRAVALVATLLVAEVLYVAYVRWGGRSATPPELVVGRFDLSGDSLARPVVWRLGAAGIVRPAATPAAEAALDDAEEVIGVSVDGETRAYRVSALSGPAKHVVNDMILGRAVTITYCDLARCTRVFTDDAAKEPLDVRVAGLEMAQRRLIVRARGVDYAQETGERVGGDVSTPPFPYAAFPSVLTTWGKWRGSNPRTSVYLGGAASATAAPL